MASSSVPDLRASDADRDRVVAALRDHAAAGRLEAAELEERVEAALAARTLGELDPLMADLPGPRPARSRRRSRRGPPATLVFVAALLVAIWAATGAGEPFWPVWPLIGLTALWLMPGCGKSRERRTTARRESRRGDAAWL